VSDSPLAKFLPVTKERAVVAARAARGPLGVIRAKAKPLTEIVKAPTWPGTIERPTPRRHLGVDYDTSWSRTPAARLARAVIVDNFTRPFIRAVASPKVIGAEQLDPLDGPLIFAANHSSHLDTAIVLSSLPARYRHHTVVAAAADYFFDRRWKGDLWSLTLGTIPMERTKVGRKSADLAAELIEDGWSVVIFPEGGRTPDGWGQEFHGGAAYLAKRCEVPVVPMHLHGVRPIFPKGGDRLRPGEVEVRFGSPLRPMPPTEDNKRGEDARKFSARVEQAVAALADEAKTDWWSARRRAAAGETPDPRGPQAAPWRRAWELPDSQRNRPVTKAKSPSKPW
jgi:1-acyl-sn-glycerol-3-phosphate acyltransferase